MLCGEGNEVVQKFYKGGSGSFKQPWNSTINENFTTGGDCRHHLIQSVPRRLRGPKNQTELPKVTELFTGRTETRNSLLFLSIMFFTTHHSNSKGILYQTLCMLLNKLTGNSKRGECLLKSWDLKFSTLPLITFIWRVLPPVALKYSSRVLKLTTTVPGNLSFDLRRQRSCQYRISRTWWSLSSSYLPYVST